MAAAAPSSSSKCFTPIQTVSVPSDRCLLCPSMDLIALSGPEKILLQRTVAWQRVSVLDNKDYCSAQLCCWSPDGMSLALALEEGGYVLYDLEMGMTNEEDSIVHQQKQKGNVITSLAWAQVGLVHAAWILEDEEKQREIEWSYRSAYLDRSAKFLPPSAYHQGDGEEEIARKAKPVCKTPLSLLCAATKNDGVRLLVHGRYPIAKLEASRPQQMVCSSDLVHLSILQEQSTKLTIYSIPAMTKHRYSLQTISALYSSIQSHLSAICDGVPGVSTAWTNAMKPLDVKMAALQKVLTSYGAKQSIGSVLVQHIILGKASEHANALDQFFTSIHMNDQLMTRTEKALHNALAGVETVARTILLAPARSLVFDANELYGMDDQLLPDTWELAETARTLLFSVEYLVAQIVQARFRMRDFISWIRSAATAVKAKGTPPDSVQHETAKKRRVPQVVINRVSDYFHQDESCNSDDVSSATERVIGCSISSLLSGSKSYVPRPAVRSESPNSIKTSLFELNGVPTVLSALQRAQETAEIAFEQPRSRIQADTSKLDVILPVNRIEGCAIHPRVGVESFNCEESTLEGALRPRTTSNDDSFSCSRQWTVVALPRLLDSAQEIVQLIVVPLKTDQRFVLCRNLLLPEHVTVKEIGFYGDDGKSALFAGKESGNIKEGRQALGLLVEVNSGQELWLVNYERVEFEIVENSVSDGKIDLLEGRYPDVNSAVPILPRTDEMDDEEEEEEVTDLIYARTRFIQSIDEQIIESKLLLCGSRGMGGVVTSFQSQTNQLVLFDLEEDEEDDEEEDDEEEDDDEGNDVEDENMQDN